MPKCVSINFASLKIIYIGTKTPTAGIILVESIHKRIKSLYLFLINANDHDTGIANAIPRKVEPNEIVIEFKAYLK